MNLEDEIDALRRLPFFAEFEPEALRLLALGAETRKLRAGDVLFRRGEDSDGGYVLTSGALALTTRDDGLPAEMILRPYALLGETAVVAATSRSATAIAREPSIVLKIARALFHRVLEEHPLTAARLRRRLARRLAEFSRELKFDGA